MSGDEQPTVVSLSAASALSQNVRLVIGWYAGVMGVKSIEQDGLDGVELGLVGVDHKTLTLVCFWRTEPNAAQQAAMAGASVFAFNLKIPVLHVLSENGKRVGASNSGALALN